MPAAQPDPAQLFQAIETRRHVALAVSGGSDSVALLRLGSQWTGAQRLTVLTVDHGLRAASKSEAEQVGNWAAGLGLPHVVLRWKPPQPLTGLQAKARAARYDLMTGWCTEHGADALLTAHTLEDQAETVLMRLARTSSLDSLAGIHRFSRWNGIELFRPLLGVKRDSLRAYLNGLGQGWIDDPSNEDERFERVRIRKALPVLRDLGITAEGLAELAWRVSDASQSLWGATDDWVKLHVEIHDTGYCSVPLDAYSGQTLGLQVRILGWLISCFGAGKTPEPAELGHLAAWLSIGEVGRRTLGGALIARRQKVLLIGREAGRIDETRVLVPPAGKLLWDGRFEVRAEAGTHVVPVRCLEGLPRRRDIPAFVQNGLPAVVGAGGVVAVPHLGVGSGAEAEFRLRDGR